MLAVGALWFSVRPSHWLYEPRERFESYVWKPDCILVYNRKVYAVEVQLTPRGSARWRQKWNVYNRYFNGGHFRQAAFQAWAKIGSGNVIMPQILVITTQAADTVRQGYNVEGRELIVVKSW